MRSLKRNLIKSKKNELLFAFFFFLLAFLLRIYLLNENLFFGWEQGRDAWVINDIVHGQKLTLIGAKTDLEGIFHGVFYYYLMAFPYFLGKGNPLIPALFIALLNSLGASFIFLVGKKRLSLISRMSAALIFSLSFQGIVFSRWLSNPSLALPFSVILLLAITRKFREINFLMAVLLWGLILHLELASALFLTPVLFYYLLVNSKQIKLSLLVKLGFILFLILSPYLAFDFRHEFILSQGLLSFFKTAEGNQPNLVALLMELYQVGLREFTLLIIPKFPLIAKIILPLGLLAAFLEREKNISKIILVWIFSPLIFVIPLRTIPMSQTLIHLGPAFFLLIALMIEKITNFTRRNYLGLIILIFILAANLTYYLESIPENKNFFFRANQYTFIGPQKKIIDFIYEEAEEKDFSFNYYTFPYWLPQGWNYLFENYGKSKYGFLPSEQGTKIFFVIIEPDEITPKYQKDWYQKIEKESQLIESFSADRLKVEKRLRI